MKSFKDFIQIFFQLFIRSRYNDFLSSSSKNFLKNALDTSQRIKRLMYGLGIIRNSTRFSPWIIPTFLLFRISFIKLPKYFFKKFSKKFSKDYFGTSSRNLMEILTRMYLLNDFTGNSMSVFFCALSRNAFTKNIGRKSIKSFFLQRSFRNSFNDSFTIFPRVPLVSLPTNPLWISECLQEPP